MRILFEIPKTFQKIQHQSAFKKNNVAISLKLSIAMCQCAGRGLTVLSVSNITNARVLSQDRACMLLLRYSSRYVKLMTRGMLPLQIDAADPSPHPAQLPPRHSIGNRCPCQFIEEHLKFKPKGKLSVREFFNLPNFKLE